MKTRPNGGAFSAIQRCFSLKYTKYSYVKGPCLAKKYLAAGHIAIYQTRPNLLAENQQIILEKLAPLDDLEVLETRVSALEAMVKKINREPAQLKNVQ